MHDRRLDGEVLTLGNQGALFMNAMTWWDHKTSSIWSQPWGAAISGPLRGKTLTLIPSELVPWATWFLDHPDTKVLIDERGRTFGRQRFNEQFIIGVSIQDAAVAYYYKSAENVRVLNHSVGDFPVALFVDPETRRIDVFLRNGIGTPVDDSVDIPEILTFEIDQDGMAKDVETGSTWNIRLGIATAGPLRGAAIQQVPYVSSWDWAWEDFFPHTQFWGTIDGGPG